MSAIIETPTARVLINSFSALTRFYPILWKCFQTKATKDRSARALHKCKKHKFLFVESCFFYLNLKAINQLIFKSFFLWKYFFKRLQAISKEMCWSRRVINIRYKEKSLEKLQNIFYYFQEEERGGKQLQTKTFGQWPPPNEYKVSFWQHKII